jgi:hypothetical protein
MTRLTKGLVAVRVSAGEGMAKEHLRGYRMLMDAAAEKGVTRQAIRYAIQRDELDYVDLRRRTLVVLNEKYRLWQRNEEMQRMGRGLPRKQHGLAACTPEHLPAYLLRAAAATARRWLKVKEKLG